MILGIHHIGVAVRSIAGVLPFYQQTAGLRCHGAAQTADNCLLAGPNAFVALHRAAPGHDAPAVPRPINAPGIRHFCVQNHDCTMLEKAVQNTGGSLIAPPLDLGTGNQYAYARDPETNIMEIEGLPYAPASQPTWIGHVAIVTEDMDASLAFFAAALGTQPPNRRAVGPAPQFDRMGGLTGVRLEGAWLPAPNMQLELWQFRAPHYAGPAPRADGREPGYSHIALETDDLADDTARLVALGCARIETPSPRSATLRTADNITIKLVQPLEAALSLSALSDPGVCARIEARK